MRLSPGLLAPTAVLVGTLVAPLAPAGAGHYGRLHGHWDTRAAGARTTLRGTLDGHRVALTFLAP